MGTLFLDRSERVGYGLQAKLLQVLQDGSYDCASAHSETR